VRELATPGFLVGRSVHGPDEIAAANREGSLNYLLFGTVWPTVSKPGARTSGAGALGEAVRATALPVLAVGGVTPARVAEVARAGAAGLAAIGLFSESADSDAHDDGPRVLAATVQGLREAWTAAMASSTAGIR